ncbi:25455_t:CDS:2, partial [Dentiscutata erythropus]
EDIDEDINQNTCGTLTEDEYIFERSAASTSKCALNFTNIRNPTKVVGKRRPKKRRYVSSIKIEQQKRGGNSTQGSYKCHICGGGVRISFHE